MAEVVTLPPILEQKLPQCFTYVGWLDVRSSGSRTVGVVIKVIEKLGVGMNPFVFEKFLNSGDTVLNRNIDTVHLDVLDVIQLFGLPQCSSLINPVANDMLLHLIPMFALQRLELSPKAAAVGLVVRLLDSSLKSFEVRQEQLVRVNWLGATLGFIDAVQQLLEGHVRRATRCSTRKGVRSGCTCRRSRRRRRRKSTSQIRGSRRKRG